jgi:hypothetical protein
MLNAVFPDYTENLPEVKEKNLQFYPSLRACRHFAGGAISKFTVIPSEAKRSRGIYFE